MIYYIIIYIFYIFFGGEQISIWDRKRWSATGPPARDFLVRPPGMLAPGSNLELVGDSMVGDRSDNQAPHRGQEVRNLFIQNNHILSWFYSFIINVHVKPYHKAYVILLNIKAEFARYWCTFETIYIMM